jgi:hypothetical protein
LVIRTGEMDPAVSFLSRDGENENE